MSTVLEQSPVDVPAPSSAGAPPPPDVVGELMRGGNAGPKPAERRPQQPKTPGLGAEGPKPEAESYTNRLRKAKNKVWEDREKDNKDKGNS